MKNFSFEKPTLFKNLKKQVTIRMVNFCYVFPQKVDVWHEKYKASTMYCFFWVRIIFYYEITKHTHNAIFTNSKN